MAEPGLFLAVGPSWLCVPAMLCYACVVCYVFFLIGVLLSKAKRQAAFAACARLLRAFRPNDSEEWNRSLDLKVRESVARERVRCVHNYARPFMHFIAWYVLAYCLLQLMFGKCGGEGGHLTLRAVEEIQVVLWFAVCLPAVLVPRIVTTRAIEVTYVLFTIWWMCRIAIVAPADIPLAIFKVSFYRAIMGILVCNAGVTSVCNVLAMAAHCAAIALRPEVAGGDGMGETDTENYLIYLMAEEIGTTLFIVCMLFFFEGWVWAASRHTLEIKASSQAEVTVRRLLSALCDAVVTLGPDLRINARAPKLANLLLHGRSARALEGMAFLDFLADTDQDRFKLFLSRAPDHADSRDPEPAQALNVHLRDSSGITVQVQLFHSPFQDLNDEVGHLIGICEVGDTGGARVEGNGNEHLQNLQANMQLGVSVDSVGTLATMDSDSDTSSVGYSASVICQRPAGGNPSADFIAPRIGGSPVQNDRGGRRAQQAREVTLVFDALRFKVMDRSSTAPVINASLLDKESLQQWVAEWSSCRAWMQDFVNAVLRPVSTATWPVRAGPPSSLSFQVSFRGSCPLPPDILTRTAERLERTPSGVHSNLGGASSNNGPTGGRGPPGRLSVSRVRVPRRMMRLNSANERSHMPSASSHVSAVSSGSSRQLAGTTPQVQPITLGAALAAAREVPLCAREERDGSGNSGTPRAAPQLRLNNRPLDQSFETLSLSASERIATAAAAAAAGVAAKGLMAL